VKQPHGEGVETSPYKQGIFLVEDDAEDRRIVEDACRQAGMGIPLRSFENGDLVLDALKTRESTAGTSVLPLLIFLDLNLPFESGKKALIAIKSDPLLRKIPILVFTTAASRQEITWAYSVGANSIIIKPFSYKEMIDIMGAIKKYWFETVELP
jgi:CheY-like chemotaxis protein